MAKKRAGEDKEKPVGVAALDPSQEGEKVEDMNTLVEPAPEMPAMDMKMPLSIGMMFYARKIDTTDPAVLNEYREYFFIIAAVTAALLIIGYLISSGHKDANKTIYVPPKKLSPSPFAPTPPPPVPPAQWEKTTYGAHEFGLLKSVVGSTAMGFGIALLMSFKFGVHMSIIMQCGTMPYAIWECLATRKHFGLVNLWKPDGPLYEELTEAPEGWTGPISEAPAADAVSNKKND